MLNMFNYIAMHVSGIERFFDNLNTMFGFKMNAFAMVLKVMYWVVTPLAVFVIFVLNCISYR